MGITEHTHKGTTMGHRQTRTISMTVGFHMPESMQAAVATILTGMLGLKTAKFEASVDEYCTTFRTDRPVRCSIERCVKLHAFMDGVRFACIAMS